LTYYVSTCLSWSFRFYAMLYSKLGSSAGQMFTWAAFGRVAQVSHPRYKPLTLHVQCESYVKRNFWRLRNFWPVIVFQLFCFL